MKKYIISSIVFLFTSGLYAQGLINNGAKIVVGTGSYVTVSGQNGNLRNETNGSVDLSGTLSLSGNVTNNVSGSDLLGTVTTGGVVVLNGSVSQTLGGTTSTPFTFPNLTVNNPLGIILSNHLQVNGSLTFTSGLVSIGNNNLTFGPQSLVVGTPSSSKMIVATGSGKVQKVWTGTGTFTYPIGDANGTAKYSPVTLNFTAGTFAPGAITGINVVNAKYNDPTITGSYLNRYWNLSQTGITSFSCNAVFQYLLSDVTGTESSINGVRVLPTPFTAYNPANTALQQLNVPGLSSFGTFTGAVTDRTLTLTSLLLQGLYAGGGTMIQAKDANGAHCPAGVADTITVELHSATSYSTIVYTARVPLSTTGTATVLVPSANNGSYYITIKHRNSLETTSATAVLFSGNSITQSFGAPGDVYAGNMQQMIDGKYTIFAGDVDQNGVIDTADMTPIENDSFNFMGGYLRTDTNGDGIIDTGDMTNVINNSNNFVGTAHP